LLRRAHLWRGAAPVALLSGHLDLHVSSASNSCESFQPAHLGHRLHKACTAKHCPFRKTMVSTETHMQRKTNIWLQR
jgi:hypothetical protein